MSNDMIQLLKTRRSIRAYTDQMIPDDVLNVILDAATYAPTAGGRQSPVIVLIKDKETRDQVAALNAKTRGSEADPYYGAPVIALVLADDSKGAAVTDGSSVVNYLMLAAKACGVDSCWIAHEKELFELEEGKQLLIKWGLPETLCGVAAAALGYAACEQPVAAPRKSDYIKVI